MALYFLCSQRFTKTTKSIVKRSTFSCNVFFFLQEIEARGMCSKHFFKKNCFKVCNLLKFCLFHVLLNRFLFMVSMQFKFVIASAELKLEQYEYREGWLLEPYLTLFSLITRFWAPVHLSLNEPFRLCSPRIRQHSGVWDYLGWTSKGIWDCEWT